MFYDVDTKKIDKLAHLSIKRGVALQKGQNLLVTAPLESLPLVRKIAEYAYKEGAGLVTPLFNDSDITLSRFKYGNNESFDVAANWLYNGMVKLLITIQLEWQLLVMIPCYYLKLILIKFHVQIKLMLLHTNQLEKELLNLKLTGI